MRAFTWGVMQNKLDFAVIKMISLDGLYEKQIVCPYCGEPIGVLVDPEEVGQHYIEDCQVCCKPIVFVVYEDSSGDIQVDVQSEDEPY